MNTNKILSPHHLLTITHPKLYMTLSCQIQFRTSFANQFGKQCVILTLHSNSSSHRQHALFLSRPLVGLLCFGLSFNLQFYPWKCVSKPGMYYILLLQVKSSNTGFEQRHNLSLKLNFPFRPVISRRRSRVET